MKRRSKPALQNSTKRPIADLAGLVRPAKEHIGADEHARNVERQERVQQTISEEFERRKRQQLAEAALKLDPTDLAILTVRMNHPTATTKQIADLVGLSRVATSRRINARKFKRAEEEAARSALEIFERNKARAARKLGTLIDSPDHHVALRACIAHMWPEIHARDKNSTEDFTSFVQQAFELAQATKPTSGDKPAPGVH